MLFAIVRLLVVVSVLYVVIVIFHLQFPQFVEQFEDQQEWRYLPDQFLWRRSF